MNEMLVIDIHPAVVDSWLKKPPVSVNVTLALGLPGGFLQGGRKINQLIWWPDIDPKEITLPELWRGCVAGSGP